MTDITEIIGKSLVQHGAASDRAVLLRLHPDDAAGMVEFLEQLACGRGYSKVCARIPSWEAARFVEAGYHLEAAIPRFYNEGGSYCFMAKYFCQERKIERQPLLVREVLVAADAQQRARQETLQGNFILRLALEDDVEELAALYRSVLAAQHSPLHSPSLVRDAMRGNALFIGVWQGSALLAASCASVDSSSCSAELRDFATLREYRGLGLARHLLLQKEAHLRPLGVGSLFALTGAYAFGMNLILASNGYQFGGTLTNENHSHGQLESVNLWHKSLQEDPGLAWSFLYQQGPGW